MSEYQSVTFSEPRVYHFLLHFQSENSGYINLSFHNFAYSWLIKKQIQLLNQKQLQLIEWKVTTWSSFTFNNKTTYASGRPLKANQVL